VPAFRSAGNQKQKKPEIQRLDFVVITKTRSGRICFPDFISTGASIFRHRRTPHFFAVPINAGFFIAMGAELDLQNLKKRGEKFPNKGPGHE
jgi:hypothetical protein